MKVALYLVVILIGVGNIVPAQIDDEAYARCLRNCPLKDAGVQDRVCTESGGVGVINRCIFDCSKLDPDRNPSSKKEVECKPGTEDHCWNTECTKEERTVTYLKSEVMCLKDPPHQYHTWPCKAKCWAKIEKKKEIEFVPCSGLNIQNWVEYLGEE